MAGWFVAEVSWLSSCWMSIGACPRRIRLAFRASSICRISSSRSRSEAADVPPGSRGSSESISRRFLPRSSHVLPIEASATTAATAPTMHTTQSTVPNAPCTGVNVRALSLSVPVVQALDASHHSEASKRDLVGVGVVTHVVGLAGPVGQERQAAGAGREPVGYAGAGGPGDHVPGTDRALLLAQHQGPVTGQDHEDLLFPRVAVRRCRRVARLNLEVLEPSLLRPGGPAQVAPLRSDPALPERCRLDRIEVDDRPGPVSGRVGELRWPQLGLSHELDGRAVDRTRARLDHSSPDERQLQPGKAHSLVAMTGAEGQDIERLDGMERVCTATSQIHDAVPGPDLRGDAALP